MAMENASPVTEFILMGFIDQPELQLLLFFLFLVNYMVTVVGSLCLMNLICLNSLLHTPMYFFLFNLSFIDLCYSCVFTPKMLMRFISEKKIISFTGCMSQLFFFCFFVNSECYVTAMACDCYVSICKPLLYTITMSPQVCSLLMSGSYVMGFASAVVHTGYMIRLIFCDSNIINYYLCDIFHLLQLSCSSTYANELVVSVVVGTVVMVSSFIISVSYTLILFNILHIPSDKGCSKAFSNGSHITVGLFYRFGLLIHVKPSFAGSVGQGKFFSVFYANVVPMLNPPIYSLRNKDVKIALKKTLKRITN
ncbi:LOW QUALITY PROTEIN: olfactory receptor 8C8-like [Megaptera novaeangliae]